MDNTTKRINTVSTFLTEWLEANGVTKENKDDFKIEQWSHNEWRLHKARKKQ